MNKNAILKLLFLTVIANFVAQIPYYLRQYYFPHHSRPSLTGLIFIALVLGWFLSGYVLLYRQKIIGYELMLSFLIVEFIFYLQTQVVQLATGHGLFLHVLHPDSAVLFGVFLIGYINFFAAGGFIYALIKDRTILIN